jgi:curli biogenesis system outer membrane secretion channel CsgG
MLKKFKVVEPLRFTTALLKTLFIMITLSACGSATDAIERHMKAQPPKGSPLAASEKTVVEINRFFERSVGNKIVISKFDDLTGARNENGTSSVVASSGRILSEYILMNANNKNRYELLDRRDLGSLVNERRLAEQINADNEARKISSAPLVLREQMVGRVPPLIDIEPLKVSDYFIYGAVVGYDRNLVDEGSGGALAGFGARNRFSRDQINVITQLVDVKTGKIISTGYASHKVDSSSISGSVFKFLSPDRLIELEQMKVINDPTTQALFFAIDAALFRMFVNV